jgi:dTDP-4-amino-4,6-dideoxygalactose transaminase
MCPKALEEAIIDSTSKGKKPKAIIAVHLYGMPFNVADIRAIADRYQIPILEDSAEALGSKYKGQQCGTFGDFGVLSFNGNKIITTSGGGALVTPTKELKEKAIFFATQSRDQAPHYQHSEIGYNYRLSNICAGIGRGQMEVLDRHIALRRSMHDFYLDCFQNIEGVTVFTEPTDDYFSNHWLSAIVVDPTKTKGKTREDLRLALEECNIESRPLWKPMHLQPIFEEYPYYGGTVANDLFENGLCLPSGSNLTTSDRERLRKVIELFFEI